MNEVSVIGGLNLKLGLTTNKNRTSLYLYQDQCLSQNLCQGHYIFLMRMTVTTAQTLSLIKRNINKQMKISVVMIKLTKLRLNLVVLFDKTLPKSLHM